MIISENVLKEKFAENEEKGLDYLLDNAETDEDIKEIEDLINLYEKYINRKRILLSRIKMN